MADLNKTFLAGRLTHDPESRQTPNGTSIASFTIANNGGKDPNGNEKVSFFDFVAWDKNADFVMKNLVKGKPVIVEAEAKQDRWDDKTDGSKRSKILFTVRQISFMLSDKTNSGGAVDNGDVSGDTVVEAPKVRVPRRSTPKPPEEEDSEIPF